MVAIETTKKKHVIIKQTSLMYLKISQLLMTLSGKSFIVLRYSYECTKANLMGLKSTTVKQYRADDTQFII